MTEAEMRLRIFELEQGIESARNTISFLHGCLTSDSFDYAYPEMTIATVQKLDELYPPQMYCVHSMHKSDCDACEAHIQRLKLHAELKRTTNG